MKKAILAIGALCGILVSLGAQAQTWSDTPAPCDNKIVAHRGGAKEARDKGITCPDNSMASLDYAMSLGCYGCETDIYITSDDRVLVAHANSEDKVNGLVVYDHTLEEIRAAGTLKNGEEIPVLEEFIDHVMVEGNPTKLVLDIKNTKISLYAYRACRFACKIITEKKAQKYVEFICTGNVDVMEQSFKYATEAGVAIGWMANQPPIYYVGHKYPWINLSVEHIKDGINSGGRSCDEYLDAGIQMSVFHLDTEVGSQYYLPYIGRLKAFSTNYPAKMGAYILEQVGPEAMAGIDQPKVSKDGDDEAGLISYYNMQGIAVTNPTQGQLLIRRTPFGSEKIIF